MLMNGMGLGWVSAPGGFLNMAALSLCQSSDYRRDQDKSLL